MIQLNVMFRTEDEGKKRGKSMGIGKSSQIKASFHISVVVMKHRSIIDPV